MQSFSLKKKKKQNKQLAGHNLHYFWEEKVSYYKINLKRLLIYSS